MAITDWPVAERPREKLLQFGPGALSDAELLAIFLRTGVKGASAVDLARELISNFGGLRPLLEADKASFCSGHGLGSAKYVQLQAVLEMARRHLQAGLEKGVALQSPDEVRDFLSAKLRHQRKEIFACLFLDNRHRLISFDLLFQGTINASAVYPREVVVQALKHNAAAAILAHNHPSGDAEPSAADEQITQRLMEALMLVDVRVLDHLIIGDREVVSLAERGMIFPG